MTTIAKFVAWASWSSLIILMWFLVAFPEEVWSGAVRPNSAFWVFLAFAIISTILSTEVPKKGGE
jgi:hypothetical protein